MFWAEQGAGSPAKRCLLRQASVVLAPVRPLQDRAEREAAVANIAP